MEDKWKTDTMNEQLESKCYIIMMNGKVYTIILNYKSGAMTSMEGKKVLYYRKNLTRKQLNKVKQDIERFHLRKRTSNNDFRFLGM